MSFASGIAGGAGEQDAIRFFGCLGIAIAVTATHRKAAFEACARALPALRTQLRGLLHYHLGTNVLRTRQVMLDVQTLDR